MLTLRGLNSQSDCTLIGVYSVARPATQGAKAQRSPKIKGSDLT
jgi:hypothetical protein